MFKKKYLVSIVFVSFLFATLGVAVADTNKEKEWRKVKRLENALRERAEIFNKAYVEQDFKGMYKLVEPEYKKIVSLREYQDYVFYFNATNAYMKAEILEVIVMPDRRLGKVLKKRSMFEIHGKSFKAKAAEHAKDEKVKPVREFIYGEDWIVVNNVWYRMESKN